MSDARRYGRRAMLRLAAGWAAINLAGCTSLIPGSGQAPQLYVLVRKTTFPSDLPQIRQQLLVAVPAATAEIDSARIALSRSPTTIDYFANAAWGDRAPLMIQSLLVESFETTGKIVGISSEQAGLRADYLLLPELRRFVAIYAAGTGEAAPTVHVRMLVRLVRMPDRVIIGETLVERRHPAERNEMEAIIDAFNEALGGVMKDIVSWTLPRISADAGADRGRSAPRT
jgi:cholesterol transport system auxiliary component